MALRKYEASWCGGALGRFERDIASKTFRHDNVDCPFADVVAFDKSVIVEMGELAFAQNAAGLSHLLKSFHFLDPDIEQSDGRAFDVEQHARHRAAHHREVDQMCLVRAD